MNSIFTKKKKTEDNNTIDSMASLSHTKWNCKYHIVFTPKYRRKIFYGQKKVRNRKNIERYFRLARGENHRG